MIFLVTGHPCIDDIRSASGERFQSWGGIFYALAALQHTTASGDRIVPVTPIGREAEAGFRERLSGYSRIDPVGIHAVPERTNTMELVYHSSGPRDEHCACVLPPLAFETIQPHLSAAQFMLANMVSGFDFTLDTLRRIRLATRSRMFIYLDVHALTLGGLPPSGPRRFHAVDDWNEWLMNVDALQLNEDEVPYFGGTEAGVIDAARRAPGVQIVNITRGARGVSVYSRGATSGEPNSDFNRADVPAERLGAIVDTTGCGDVFGAAFLARFSRSRDAVDAAAFGGHIAAANAMLAGANEIDRLADSVAHFPALA